MCVCFVVCRFSPCHWVYVSRAHKNKLNVSTDHASRSFRHDSCPPNSLNTRDAALSERTADECAWGSGFGHREMRQAKIKTRERNSRTTNRHTHSHTDGAHTSCERQRYTLTTKYTSNRNHLSGDVRRRRRLRGDDDDDNASALEVASVRGTRSVYCSYGLLWAERVHGRDRCDDWSVSVRLVLCEGTRDGDGEVRCVSKA